MIKFINSLDCRYRLKREKTAITMIEYVKGSDHDNWHWCANCTQYPMYIYEKTTEKPISDLCPQCVAKEEDEDCHCEGLKTTLDPQLRREVSNIDIRSAED